MEIVSAHWVEENKVMSLFDGNLLIRVTTDSRKLGIEKRIENAELLIFSMYPEKADVYLLSPLYRVRTKIRP